MNNTIRVDTIVELCANRRRLKSTRGNVGVRRPAGAFDEHTRLSLDRLVHRGYYCGTATGTAAGSRPYAIVVVVVVVAAAAVMVPPVVSAGVRPDVRRRVGGAVGDTAGARGASGRGAGAAGAVPTAAVLMTMVPVLLALVLVQVLVVLGMVRVMMVVAITWSGTRNPPLRKPNRTGQWMANVYTSHIISNV